jgi:CheY-like chemotaxis protein
VTKPKQPQQQEAPGEAAAGKRRPGGFVLVVDDFADNREMYAEYLRFAGFEVAEASDGREALEKARALLPDVIVMDLSLPVMDGWTATRALKADPRTKQIAVIVVTGHALAGHSQGAAEAGCDAFLTKPCLPDILEQKVRQMLSSRGRKAEKDKPARR